MSEKIAPVPEGAPISSARKWAITFTVMVVAFMQILDTSVTNVILPHLQGSLSFIYPVVAILVDVVAFGHRLHPLQIVGATAILIAAAGMNLGWTLWKAKSPAESPQAVK